MVRRRSVEGGYSRELGTYVSMLRLSFPRIFAQGFEILLVLRTPQRQLVPGLTIAKV